MMKKVNPSKFVVIINETHIVLLITKRINYKSPNIKNMSSKAAVDTLFDIEYGS
jgi:hypothetical protein